MPYNTRYPKLCPEGCTQHPRHIQGMAIDADGFALDRNGRRFETCAEAVPDGGRAVTFHNCGRKLKGSSEFPWLCGMHVAAILRARSRTQQRASVREQMDAQRETAGRDLEELNDRLGITSTLDLSYASSGPEPFLGGRPTGNAIVPVAKLRELADRLHELEQENLRRRLGEQ